MYQLCDIDMAKAKPRCQHTIGKPWDYEPIRLLINFNLMRELKVSWNYLATPWWYSAWGNGVISQQWPAGHRTPERALRHYIRAELLTIGYKSAKEHGGQEVRWWRTALIRHTICVTLPRDAPRFESCLVSLPNSVSLSVSQPCSALSTELSNYEYYSKNKIIIAYY